MECGDMLSSEDKILIRTCGKLKHNFCPSLEMHRIWMISHNVEKVPAMNLFYTSVFVQNCIIKCYH